MLGRAVASDRKNSRGPRSTNSGGSGSAAARARPHPSADQNFLRRMGGTLRDDTFGLRPCRSRALLSSMHPASWSLHSRRNTRGV